MFVINKKTITGGNETSYLLEIVISQAETGSHGFNRENFSTALINISIIREEGRDSKRPRKDFHFITSRGA